MRAYFDKVNKSFHLAGTGEDLHLESESYQQEFSLPLSYEYPNVNLS